MLVCDCGTRMGSACHHDHAPALIVICTGAATKLRLLVEQASGCCTVRGKGGINNQGVCVLVCVCSTRMMESAGQRDSSVIVALGWEVLASATTHQH